MVDQDVLGLVSRAMQKDEDAFAELIQRFERSALALAYSILHNADRSGDVVQEAFIRGWKELHKLQEPQRFAGWFMQIVRNAAIDAKRRIRPMVTEYPELEGKGPAPYNSLQEQEKESQVKAALEKLDETTRSCVMLRYFDGKTAKEIAELLQLSAPAVDMRLSRARGILRDELVHLMEGAAAGGKIV